MGLGCINVTAKVKRDRRVTAGNAPENHFIFPVVILRPTEAEVVDCRCGWRVWFCSAQVDISLREGERGKQHIVQGSYEAYELCRV